LKKVRISGGTLYSIIWHEVIPPADGTDFFQLFPTPQNINVVESRNGPNFTVLLVFPTYHLLFFHFDFKAVSSALK
jgi:hypothetical protein